MLTSVFGISIKYEAWNHQDSLPVYIAGSYDFHTAYIGNRRCIMLAPTEELATLPALKKQIVKIQQIDNVPVVFELTTVSNYRRKSLIENNIPFITDKQVFLPFIGTMLMFTPRSSCFYFICTVRKNDCILQKPEKCFRLQQ